MPINTVVENNCMAYEIISLIYCHLGLTAIRKHLNQSHTPTARKYKFLGREPFSFSLTEYKYMWPWNPPMTPSLKASW